jgi:hypothetical protein
MTGSAGDSRGFWAMQKLLNFGLWPKQVLFFSQVGNSLKNQTRFGQKEK